MSGDRPHASAGAEHRDIGARPRRQPAPRGHWPSSPSPTGCCTTSVGHSAGWARSVRPGGRTGPSCWCRTRCCFPPRPRSRPAARVARCGRSTWSARSATPRVRASTWPRTRSATSRRAGGAPLGRGGRPLPLVRRSRRSSSPRWPRPSPGTTHHAASVAYPLALLVGITHATNSLEGGTAVFGLVVAVLGCGWGWVTRARLGRLLLVAYAPALLIVAGYGLWHGGFPQPSELG